MSQTNAKRQMPSRLVWIDEKRFRGFGCSKCSWRFEPTGAPTGTSFAEMMRNFELQRDKEFKSHVCADHSKKGYVPTGTRRRPNVKI